MYTNETETVILQMANYIKINTDFNYVAIDRTKKVI